MSRATIGDVAKQAGVSKKTVSRVLNNEPGVKAETFTQVMAAIEHLGYKPDLSARRLRKGQSFLLAIIYPDAGEHSDPYVNALLRGALNGCDKFGYDLLLRPIPPSADALVELVSNFIDRTQVDGLIISPPTCDDPQILAYLASQNIPYVRISPKAPSGNADVLTNEVCASKDAINTLISQGHQRIAIVNPLCAHGAGVWRSQGFKEAMRENGIEVKPEYVLETTVDDHLEKNIRKLLSLEERPSAVFAVNDSYAAIVYRVAYQLGIVIPHQLSVLGFDDAPLAQHLWPPLTSIHQPIIGLAEQAVEVLVKHQLEGKEISLEPLQCQLIQRSSIAPHWKLS